MVTEVVSKVNPDLGKTLDVYRKISVILNSFEEGEEISVEDLAKKAGVHWNTAKKAIIFLSTIDRIAPKLQLESKHKFRVTEKPDAFKAIDGVFSSPDTKLLVKLMLLRAVDRDHSIKIDEFTNDKQTLQELISKGCINSIDGNFYLSKKGQSLAGYGIRELVELGIELPWTQSIKKARSLSHPENLAVVPTINQQIFSSNPFNRIQCNWNYKLVNSCLNQTFNYYSGRNPNNLNYSNNIKKEKINCITL